MMKTYKLLFKLIGGMLLSTFHIGMGGVFEQVAKATNCRNGVAACIHNVSSDWAIKHYRSAVNVMEKVGDKIMKETK